MKDQEIDKLFKDRLLEKELMPSPRAWAALESQLDQQERRRKIGLWWIPAAAAMLTGIGLGVHLYTAPAESQTAWAQKPATVVFTEIPAMRQQVSIQDASKAQEVDTPAIASATAPGKAAKTQPGSKAIARDVAGNQPTKPKPIRQAPEVLQQQPAPGDIENEILQDAVAVNTIASTEDEVTVIIKVGTEAEPDGSATPERHKTRAGRILAQLKNFKNGEEVDLKAFGINAEKLPFKRSAD